MNDDSLPDEQKPPLPDAAPPPPPDPAEQRDADWQSVQEPQHDDRGVAGLPTIHSPVPARDAGPHSVPSPLPKPTPLSPPPEPPPQEIVVPPSPIPEWAVPHETDFAKSSRKPPAPLEERQERIAARGRERAAMRKRRLGRREKGTKKPPAPLEERQERIAARGRERAAMRKRRLGRREKGTKKRKAPPIADVPLPPNPFVPPQPGEARHGDAQVADDIKELKRHVLDILDIVKLLRDNNVARFQ